VLFNFLNGRNAGLKRDLRQFFLAEKSYFHTLVTSSHGDAIKEPENGNRILSDRLLKLSFNPNLRQ
jgi:hypothetical protein